MMHKIFQMSSMRELTFFLRLQVKQKDNGIFISQDKYVANILNKFDFATVKTSSTPIETNKTLLNDEEVEYVDVHLYRSMIGSLTYLTASRPDIIYLKVQPKLGLWYPRDSPFDLEAFSDSDYAGASLDKKSTIGCCKFLGKRKAKRTTEISQSSEPIPLITDKTIIKEWEDRMERATTTASSLVAEQDSESQTRFEDASKQSNDLPLSRVNILGSGEDRMKLKEMVKFCIKLSKRALDLRYKNK
ncbi:uncharacterized mitochondrial protein-like protein [Tanacetum coccineum]